MERAHTHSSNTDRGDRQHCLLWPAGAPGVGTRPNSATGPANGRGADIDAAAKSQVIADRRSNSAACADLDGSRHVDHRSHDCPNDNAHVSSANLDPIANARSANRDPIAHAGHVGGYRDAPQDV